MNPVTDPALLEILNGSPQQGPVYGPPPVQDPPKPVDPLIQRQRELNIAKTERELARPDSTNAPAGYRYTANGDLEPIPGGPADKSGAGRSADPKVAQRLANLEALTNQINRVQSLYNENLKDEAFGVLSSLGEYLPTSANKQFDSAAAGLAEQGLAAFRVPGVGAQSDTELRQFVEANKPQASDRDAQIEEKLLQLRSRVDATRSALGLEAAQWQGIDGQYGSANPTPPALTNAPTQYEQSDSGTRSTVDPETSALMDKMIRAGAPVQAINSMLRGRQFDPIDQQAYEEWRTFLSQNPDYDGSTAEAVRTEQLSGVDAAGNALGGFLGDGATAFLTGAGQFLSGNTLDNLASDPAAARIGMAQQAEDNPGATFAGELTGGVLAALTGEAGLARLGMASGLGRGIVADTAMGAANGAGAADDGSRLAGAIGGGLSAGAGSAAGGVAVRAASKALSPTGGRLANLYAEGVRPTPGQRFAESGTLGGLLNAAEEHMQSVPGVGAAIRGARSEARDQFQVGAFNQALREIGDELPAGTKPGTDPHRYAQEAFSRIYDEARSGMRVVADEQLANDLTELGPDIETLGPAAQNKLKAIMANTIKDDLSGDAYKRSMSDLGKHIARLSRSAMGEEQQLAEILTGIRNSLDSAARRHSDPDAVKLLDAADRGYAKLVRIEEAAARRGGEPGTFTPNNFDSSVQKSSGGVRSKAYLRGDALMGEYAEQGKTLSDRVPNSGTPERQMAGLVATGGLGYLSSPALAALGALGALYAPGVRRATKGAFAPSAGKRKAIAERLKKIERLTSAATGAAGAQAAIPSQ